MKRSRKPSLTWKTKKEGAYIDHKSDNDKWWIAEGFDEHLKKQGKPHLLMHCRDPRKGQWSRVDGFASVREAKHFAEEMSE